MLYPIQFIIDTIFPPTEHELLLRPVSKIRFTSWHRPHLAFGTICLSEYHVPAVQAAIAACKFEHSYHAASLLSALAQLHLSTLPVKKTLLIPVPLSRKREYKRGFNQVTRVLSGLGQLPYHTSVCATLLIRTTNTTPQTALTRKQRLTNLHQAFLVVEKNKFYLDGIERIIICDDVTTTGATLKAAKETLLPHVSKEVEIMCTAWAH